MVGYGGVWWKGERGEGKHVVVVHGVLVAVVVILDGGRDVVGWVDVDSVVEDVGGGVGGEDVGYEGLGGHLE